MWAIFEKAFYDSRRTVVWLSLGIAVLGFLVAGIYPAFAAEMEQFARIYEALPDVLISLVGGDVDFSDPAVFMNVEFLLWAVLILGAVVMVQAFNAVTNAERNGTMDVMLAFPVSRRDVLLGRYLNTLLTLLIVLTATFLTIFSSSLIWQEIAIAPADIAMMVYGSLVILIPYTTFTYALTAILPSSRRWAGAISYSLFFGMYFVHSLTSVSDALTPIQPFLLFEYYNGIDIAQDGLQMSNILIMAALTVVLLAVAWWRFDEKDLGV